MTLQTRIIIGTVMLVFAAAFGVAGFFILRRSFRLRTRGHTADGVIVGCDKRLVDSLWRYFPKIEFQSQDGDTHVFTASAGGSQMPRVGRSIRVSYLPNDPEDADVSSFGGIPFFGLVMFLFAVGFFGMSLIFYTGLVEQP
jgi:Protein of unknown function (DUF3592)